MVPIMWGKVNRKKIASIKQRIAVPAIVFIVVFSSIFFPLYFNAQAQKKQAENVRFLLTVSAVQITDMLQGGQFTLKIAGGYRGDFNTYPVKLEGAGYYYYDKVLVTDQCFGKSDGYVYSIQLRVKMKRITSQTIILTLYTSGTGISVWSPEYRFEKFGGFIKLYYSITFIENIYG